MPFELPPLPYPANALEPFMSGDTLNFHHGKHHKKYVDTLNELIAGTRFEQLTLGEIIQESADGKDTRKLFNNAAQTWNHTFFWHCMQPNGGGSPSAELARRIDSDIGGMQAFTEHFRKLAEGQFGSGYAWLVVDQGKLKITTTHDAEPPTVHGQLPLLACDVWEHAYYLDYQNRRGDFVDAFVQHLVNWDFVAAQLDFQGEGNATAAREYLDRTLAFTRSGKVEQAAREASAAVAGPEGEQLRQAEEAGRRHARG